MATVPTGKMERELRRLYMRWVHQLPRHQDDLHNYVAKFRRDSMDLIERMGGDIARLGILADFPAPKRLDLSLHVGTIYSDMELAAISAQIGLGLNPRQTAEALVQSGVDKSYRRLERLARTETVRAYWKNSWDSVEDLGLVMLWSAERGPRTCDPCLERDGMVVPSREVRDHPNGRCTLVAELPSRVNYKGSVAPDGSIYNDPDWDKAYLKALGSQPLSGEGDPTKAASSTSEVGTKFSQASMEAGSKSADKFIFDVDADAWGPTERAAWTEYVDGNYAGLNKLYRDPAAFVKEVSPGQAMDLQRKADTLEKLFDQHTLPTETITYRGVAATEKFNPKALELGQDFADPGLFSTSASRSVAEDFRDHMSPTPEDGWLIIVKSPPGTKALPGLHQEAELMLKPGQVQQVVGIDPTTRIIYMEVRP